MICKIQTPRFKSIGITTALYPSGTIPGIDRGVLCSQTDPMLLKNQLPIVYMLICPIILDKFEKTTEMSKIYPNTRVKQF